MKKVLAIDDDADTLFILNYLATKANIELVSSTHLLQIDEIQGIMPDLILLDHWVGEALGGDLCLQLKQTGATKDIPVIMFSALNDIDKIARDSNADGYITKPFDFNDINELFIQRSF